ncbi:MAG: isopentenyl transferase family protein [Pseudomonadota bacterium]
MKRVMVVGAPGSGKSTLAIALGRKTGLPVYHMDRIHWQPGWQSRDVTEKDHLTHEVHQKEAWIFEGGHSRTYPERLARADTLVWLDLPVTLRYWRVGKRWWMYRGGTRPDLPENCPERLDGEFLRYIWTSRRRTRQRHLDILKNPGDLKIHHLQTRSAVRRFLSAVPTQSEGQV